MPDIQTALKEALNEWSDSAGRHQVEKQQPTPLPEVNQMQAAQTKIVLRGRTPKPENESDRREIFYFIKCNPDCSLQDLMDNGFDKNASTHLSNLYFNGKITRKAKQVQRPIHSGRIATRDVFVYAVAIANYQDVPAVVPNKQAKKIIIRKRQPAAQPAQGIAALPTEVKHTRIPRPPMETFIAKPETAPTFDKSLTTEYVMQNISLSEAVKLHAELKKMLG
jgi:hypothetical protein